MSVKPILARATIHMPDGIYPGELYWVDPNSPYIQECLEGKLLVPVNKDGTDKEPDE